MSGTELAARSGDPRRIRPARSTVGYLAAAAIVEGLKLAHVAAQQADAAEAELAQLEGWISDAIQRLEDERQVIEQLNEVHAEHFKTSILPVMEAVEQGLFEGSVAVFTDLDMLCQTFDSALPFISFEDFERFMADDQSPLML